MIMASIVLNHILCLKNADNGQINLKMFGMKKFLKCYRD